MRTIVVPLALLLIGCVSDTPAGKKQGELGGPCYDNGSCNAGLVCAVPNMCVPMQQSDGGIDAQTMDASGTDSGPDGSEGGMMAAYCSSIISWWSGDDVLADKKSVNIPVAPMVAYAPGEVADGFNVTSFSSAPLVNIATGVSSLTGLTVEAWIKPTSFPTAGQIITMNGDAAMTANGFGLYVDSNGMITFYVVGAGSIKSNVPVKLNMLSHVAGVFHSGASGLTVYVNGLAAGATFSSSAMTQSPINPRLRIGASADTDKELFTGVIDEATIYNIALAATDIQSIFNAGSAGKCK